MLPLSRWKSQSARSRESSALPTQRLTAVPNVRKPSVVRHEPGALREGGEAPHGPCGAESAYRLPVQARAAERSRKCVRFRHMFVKFR